MGGKPGGNNQNNQHQNFINQEFLCEFDQFQPVDANADPQNLIDPDSVLQEYQLLEQTQNAFAPQSLSSDNQDLSSIDETQFLEYIMNPNVPNDALENMLVGHMVASNIPEVNQTPMIPVSATADPLLNIIFDTPSTISMEASSPAAIVSVPSSYTEPSMTAPEVAPSMIEVAPSMILNFDPETGTIELAPINSAPSSPSSSISSSIDLDQLSTTSSPGRTKVDNKERCKQYRQRIKNKNKSDEADYEVLKIRNIELKSKAAIMEEQCKKMKKMVVAAIRQGKMNANLANKIKLEFSFLDI